MTPSYLAALRSAAAPLGGLGGGRSLVLRQALPAPVRSAGRAATGTRLRGCEDAVVSGTQQIIDAGTARPSYTRCSLGSSWSSQAAASSSIKTSKSSPVLPS